ncbi:hypothetical protein LAh9_12 [Aeromonas phage LAh_9]|uniref:Uncharacterized protein n=1 Tax=Aeromonas phage LAh_9 TaxID=2591033 RepID=A0A514A148_9CAUD|nr:hypothetical protein HWC32_gp012 [Aeromonas phage LAh_9]QDH46952.1 hypothetical protein LAh9_12 [Aeromonas phage LAh_9]
MIVNLNHIYSHLRGHCVVIVTHDTSLMRDGAAIHIHLSRNKLTVFHMGYGVSCILGGYPYGAGAGVGRGRGYTGYIHIAGIPYSIWHGLSLDRYTGE